jgi:hypothetical protein
MTTAPPADAATRRAPNPADPARPVQYRKMTPRRTVTMGSLIKFPTIRVVQAAAAESIGHRPVAGSPSSPSPEAPTASGLGTKNPLPPFLPPFGAPRRLDLNRHVWFRGVQQKVRRLRRWYGGATSARSSHRIRARLIQEELATLPSTPHPPAIGRDEEVAELDRLFRTAPPDARRLLLALLRSFARSVRDSAPAV